MAITPEVHGSNGSFAFLKPSCGVGSRIELRDREIFSVWQYPFPGSRYNCPSRSKSVGGSFVRDQRLRLAETASGIALSIHDFEAHSAVDAAWAVRSLTLRF